MNNANVTKHNFDEILPTFTAYLKEASFVAIDTEFTGITQNFLKDDGAARYKRLRQHCAEITVCQVGICLFIERDNGRRYEALPYSFHVFPRVVGNLNRKFTIESSSAEFLAYNNFDFNKFIYDGIPYLNQNDVDTVRAYVTNYEGLKGTDRCSFQPDGDSERGYSEVISAWLVSGGGSNGCLTVDVSAYRQPQYLLHVSLRARFTDIWTTRDAGNRNTMIVRKVTAKERLKLERKVPAELERSLQEMSGFSRVISLIQAYQTPVVAHNSWLDLLLIYHHFYRHLPAEYSDMKRCLHSLFPEVYDTKHIVYNLRKTEICHKPEVVAVDQLAQLYDAVISSQTEVLASPPVRVSAVCEDMKSIPHDAAYDAYMCGCVFLQLAHLMAVHKNDSLYSGMVYRCNNYLGLMMPYMNRVNVIKARIDHMNICGSDGQSKPIQSYLISHSDATQCVSMVEFLQLYSNADAEYVNQTGSRAVLTVCNRKDCYEELCAAAKRCNMSDLTVTRYRLPSSSSSRGHTHWRYVTVGALLGVPLLFTCTVAALILQRHRTVL